MAQNIDPIDFYIGYPTGFAAYWNNDNRLLNTQSDIRSYEYYDRELIHELGHMLQHSYVTYTGGGHGLTTPTNYITSFSEAFADFISTIVPNNDIYASCDDPANWLNAQTIETNNYEYLNEGKGDIVEGCLQLILYDLYDNTPLEYPFHFSIYEILTDMIDAQYYKSTDFINRYSDLGAEYCAMLVENFKKK